MANEGQEDGHIKSEKVDQVKSKTLGVSQVVASTTDTNLVQVKPTAKQSASTGNISEIGNKEVRHMHYVKLKREKKKDKKKVYFIPFEYLICFAKLSRIHSLYHVFLMVDKSKW